MKQIYTLAIIIAVFYFPCLAAAQTGDVQQHADSLRAVIAAAEGEAKLDAYDKLKEHLYYNTADPEPLLKVLDDCEREALRQGNQRKAAASRANKMIVLRSHRQFERLLESADDDLKFIADIGEWNLYFKAYTSVVTALFLNGQRDKAAEEAAKCREEAEQVGTPFARASSLYLTGMILGWNMHDDEALKYFDEAIRAIGDDNDPDSDALKLNIYGYSMQSMTNQNDMDGWKKLLADWETEIARQEALGAEVFMTRLDLYEGYMRYYSDMKDWDKMEEYCVLIEQSSNNPETVNHILYFRTKAEIARGNWERALEHLDAVSKYAEQTEFQVNKFVTMRERTRVMIHLGRWDDALASFDRTLELRDSVSEMDFNRQLTELKTQYEVERHVAEKQRSRNYFIFALGVCLLLAVALGIYIYYSRKIVRKNRELVRKAQQWANIEPAPMIAEKDRDRDELPEEEPLPKTDKTAAPDETDKMLFAEIELLIDRGLYKESNLSLDMLAEKTGQNPTYISKAVSHCTGKTFKAWLNEYRIKEAVRLLSDKNSPNITVETVAWDSGFNDRKTFHRIFKNTTGLSPAEFKKNELRK